MAREDKKNNIAWTLSKNKQQKKHLKSVKKSTKKTDNFEKKAQKSI